MNSDYIAGLEEAMRLLSLNDLDFGPGRILKRIEQLKSITESDRTGMSREQLESALAQREDQLRLVEAQCADMREALVSINNLECELEHSDECVCCLSDSPAKVIAEEALSTDCGEAILARLEEARWLLGEGNK